MAKIKERTKVYLSQLFFLAACVGLAGAAVYSNTKSTKASPSSENLVRIEGVIDETFEMEQELELYEDSRRSVPVSKMDAGSLALIENNNTNIKRLSEGKKPVIDEAALSQPLISDFRQAWAQIERVVDSVRDIDSQPETFDIALKNYERAYALKKFPADERGNAYLKRAYQGFVQVLMQNPSPVIRDYALYFLGDIGFRLWSEDQDLAGAAYMVDLISTTQNSQLAQKAWLKLNAQIHFGYTGSSGDNTPVEWQRFLAQLHSVSNRTRAEDLPLLSLLNN